MTHADIIARLTAATGPDRELDAEIWLALTKGATRKLWSYQHKGTGRVCHVDETRDASRCLIIVPAYTTSVDACLALIERVLPEHGCYVIAYPDFVEVTLVENSDRNRLTASILRRGEGGAPTEPLARLIALFRALEATGVPHHG